MLTRRDLRVAQVRSLHPPRGRSSTVEPLASTQKMRVRFPLPAPACLRLAAQDSRLSSGTTRVQIPQAGPNPPSLKLRRANRQPVEARSAKIGFVPLRLTAGCRTLNAAIVVRIHEGEPTRNAGVAQRQSGALIRRRSVVQISPPAPAFARRSGGLRLASQPRGARRRASAGKPLSGEGCPP